MSKRLLSTASFAFLLVISFHGRGQTPILSSSYPPGSKLFVFTPSGLTLRNAPDVKGAPIQVIPYGEKVAIIEYPKQAAFVSGNISGHWAKVKYGTKEGYAFDGYLSRLIPLDVSFRMDAYLKRSFKILDSISVTPDTTIVQYEKTRFVNGIVYESKWYEGGGTISIFFPAQLINFKELYLLTKVIYPYYYATTSKCKYEPEYVTCDDESEMAGLMLQRKGESYVITDSMAD